MRYVRSTCRMLVNTYTKWKANETTCRFRMWCIHDAGLLYVWALRVRSTCRRIQDTQAWLHHADQSNGAYAVPIAAVFAFNCMSGMRLTDLFFMLRMVNLHA
jgi:hypothetical protein